MKLRSLLLLLLFVSSSLFAKVIEIKRMDEIMEAITLDTLVVFDLDNTIMESSQTLGSDQWFDHRVGQLKKIGFSTEDALKSAAKDWQSINAVGYVQLVERETPSIIAEIQDLGIPTLGLTARQASFADHSLRQLRQLEVPLHRRTVSKDTITLPGHDVALFKRGLLSVGGNNKGTMLLSFLKRIGYTPRRIVFVDDKQKNVENVDEALTGNYVASFAFRYGAADWKVKNFNARLADFQFDYFKRTGTVLSDAKAKALMPR